MGPISHGQSRLLQIIPIVTIIDHTNPSFTKNHCYYYCKQMNDEAVEIRACIFFAAPSLRIVSFVNQGLQLSDNYGMYFNRRRYSMV